VTLKKRRERIEKENMRKSLEEIYQERDLDQMFKEGDFQEELKNVHHLLVQPTHLHI
jgi:hypothetical protein